MKRKIVMTILLAAAFSMTACAPQTKEEDAVIELAAAALAEPQTTQVFRGDLEVSVTYDATIGPKVVQLTFEEEGVFGEYKALLGDTVKEGDILAVPDMEDMEQKVQDKERELDNLKANFQYKKATYENNIKIIDLRMEDLYAQLEEQEYMKGEYSLICSELIQYDEEKKRLQLQLQQLEEAHVLELSHCERQLEKLRAESSGNVIRAPFDGTIVAWEDDAELIDTSKYYVALADSNVFYARCEYMGQSILNAADRVVFWKDGKEYEVSYLPMDSEIYRKMKNNKEVIYSEFEVLNTEGLSLGDYGKIKLILAKKEQILLLPEIAVLTDAGGSYVYVDKNGRQERVSVTTGSSDGIRIEIVEGLQEGDVVYVQE